MIPDLITLLASTGAEAAPSDFAAAVVERNVLGKPSLSVRRDSLAYLRDRFALAAAVPLLAGLRALWTVDAAGQSLLAMLLAAARDPVLRVGATVLAATPIGTTVNWHTFEVPIREAFIHQGSEKSVRFMAERQPASWMQSGYLWQEMPSRRVRSRAMSRPATVAYALWLGQLTGLEGDDLFTSFWIGLLDAPPELVDEQAREASRQGLIELRRGGAGRGAGGRGVGDGGGDALLRGHELDQ